MTNIYCSVCLPYLFIVNENHNHRLSWKWTRLVIQGNVQTEKLFWRLPQKYFVDILSNPRWDPAPSTTALSCFFSNFTWKGLIRKICHPSSNIFGHSNYNTSLFQQDLYYHHNPMAQRFETGFAMIWPTRAACHCFSARLQQNCYTLLMIYK